MNAATSAVATGLIITAGRWADNKDSTGMDVKLVVGLTGYAVVLSVIESWNEDIAARFALLVMIVAAFQAFARVKGVRW